MTMELYERERHLSESVVSLSGRDISLSERVISLSDRSIPEFSQVHYTEAEVCVPCCLFCDLLEAWTWGLIKQL